MIDQSRVATHLQLLFPCPLGEKEYICLRGIGEKGTEREGVFKEDIFLHPFSDPAWIIHACNHVKRWSENSVASFVVPGALKEARGTAEAVTWIANIVVDIDSGDTTTKLQHAEKYLGKPTMIVESGGTTEEGFPKVHAYWQIPPTQDIAGVVKIRHALAVAVGGDPQFGLGVPSNPYGRAHQPVRIAGSLNCKGGNKKPVSIREHNPDSLMQDPSELLTLAESMPRAPGLPEVTEDQRYQFKAEKKVELSTDVKAGGEGEETRWSMFNRVSGHYIHCARVGEMTIDEAKDSTYGWMQAHMLPPWPDARFAAEWKKLVNRDVGIHGQFPKMQEPIVPQGNGLEIWAAHRWSMGDSPKRQFIVPSLILAGKHQLMVAEGGAGKTFLALDLAMKVASFTDCKPENTNQWCGKPIIMGGTTVILTTEDDKDELHIRLNDIDPDGRLRALAGDKFIVLPTINTGGAFCLAERDARTGEIKASKKWAEMLGMLSSIKDLTLVVVDTLNSTLHGDENSAVVINEFVRQASQVCGQLGAALLMTHHIRKQGDEPIRNAEDMKSAVRGSSALPAAFRSVIGIWHCSDYDRRMQAMGLTPERGWLWKMAIIKANNPEMMRGELTLLRNETGLLRDVSDDDSFHSVNTNEREAWLFMAIRLASEAGHPYSVEGKNAKSGLYRRRGELPPLLRQTGPSELAHMVDKMLQSGVIITASASGTEKKWLDTPQGRYANCDEDGEEISSGAYLDQPKWADYEYDHEVKSCIRKGTKKPKNHFES